MKQVLKLIVVLCLLAGSTQAQWTAKKNTTSTVGSYGVYVQDSSAANGVFIVNNGVPQSSQWWSTEYNFTTGSTADSVNWGFKCNSGLVINDSGSDTMYVAMVNNQFGTHTTQVLYPGESWWIAAGKTYLVFKIGYTPKSGKKVRVAAW